MAAFMVSLEEVVPRRDCPRTYRRDSGGWRPDDLSPWRSITRVPPLPTQCPIRGLRHTSLGQKIVAADLCRCLLVNTAQDDLLRKM